MKATAVAEIKAGMVLARDIIDKSGKVIMAAGSILNDSHREMLLRRGVTTAIIRDSTTSPFSDQGKGEALATVADQTRELLAVIEYMFAPHSDDLRMQELKRIAIKHALRDKDHA